MTLSFLDGNSATFLAAIATLAVLCFFSSSKKAGDNTRTTRDILEDYSEYDNNFVRKLLSIIAKRTVTIIKSEAEIKINLTTEENYEHISKAIAESETSTNPYKQKMLDLSDELQFNTVTFQNKIFNILQNIINLYYKITYNDTIEFLSSPFYTFLFCITVLFISCICGSHEWCINVVCTLSIISFAFWGAVWAYYWMSIKKRRENPDNTEYKFSCIRYCIICVVLLVAYILLYKLLVFYNYNLLAPYVWIPILLIHMIILLLRFAYKKRAFSIFTHYFNLVHFIFILIFSILLSSLYYYLEIDCIFTQKFAKIISLSFAIVGCLILPLAIPIFRINGEANKALKMLKIITDEYLDNNKKCREKLEKYFDVLDKIKTLSNNRHKNKTKP